MAKINLLMAPFLFLALIILIFLRLLLYWPGQLVEIIFCDVGQGDAILIQRQFTQVLIDSGSDQSVISCLEKALPLGDRTIEMAVATHPDKDHIGGFQEVFNRFFIVTMLLEPVSKDTDFFLTFKALLLEEKKQGMKVIYPKAGDFFGFDQQLEFFVLSPQVVPEDKTSFLTTISETTLSDKSQTLDSGQIEYNDLSIVLLLRVNQVLVGLNGDLEESGELALVESGLTNKLDVLKIGHHGSKTSSTGTFLAATRPEISVISSGKNNTYGHPDPTIIDKILTFSEKIIRTDQVGSIKIVTNGRNYWFSESLLEEEIKKNEDFLR